MAKRVSEQERDIKKASVRNRERALREERLGLAAICKVIVLEVPDPGRLLARLEAMTRSASQQPNTPVRVRQALIDGTAMVRNAINRELGKPQELLDPPTYRHVNPSEVDRLVGGEAMSDQLGLTGSENPLEDVLSAHEEQTKTILAIHERLVELLRQDSATDMELYRRYVLLEDAPPHSPRAIAERRRELMLGGRLTDSGTKRDGNTVWTLVENRHKTPDIVRTWKRGGKKEERVQCPDCNEWFGKGAGIAVHRKAKHSEVGFIRRG